MPGEVWKLLGGDVAIDPIYLSVTLIEQYSSRTRVGSATGFFYQHGDALFLVTNRHVVVDEEEHFFPDELRIRLHLSADDLSKNDWVRIPLYDGAERRWIEHPTLKCDLAFIKVDKSIETKFLLTSWSRGRLRPKDIVVSLGDPLIVLGFPLGFYDKHNNLPIARNATLASPYPAPFGEESFFLVEARLHEGTSGGPVLFLPRSRTIAMETGIRLLTDNYLLGVHSGAFHSGVPTEPLDLNTCWFAELVDDALNRLFPLPAETGPR